MSSSVLGDRLDDGSLQADVLHQHPLASVGGGLLPVQLHELQADALEGKIKFAIVVVSHLHCQVGQGDEQGKLVGGREVALRKQALQLAQEFKLELRAGLQRWLQ